MAEAESLKALGNKAFQGRNYEEAIEHYTKAIEIDPTSEVAALCYSNRSAAHQGLKNWVEVEKDARACLHIKPEFIKGYKRLALAQRKLGNLKGALETVEAGLKREPKNKELAKTRQKVKQEIAVAAKKSNLVDQKLFKAVQGSYQELQTQAEALQGQIAEVEMELRDIDTSRKRANLTVGEVSKLPAGTNTYLSVGKMFIKTPLEESQKFLKDKISAGITKSEALRNKHEYLAGKLKSIKANQQELLSSIRAN